MTPAMPGWSGSKASLLEEPMDSGLGAAVPNAKSKQAIGIAIFRSQICHREKFYTAT